jgi:uroporphyrinogen decarboxylase
VCVCVQVIPQAMGLTVEMKKDHGPHLPQPIVDPTHLSRLLTIERIDVPRVLSYVFESITVTRHALCGRVPLLGFAGAPWTLMCYIVEGGGAKSYNKAKAWLYRWPDQAHALLQSITDVTVEYLLCQVRAGAQMLEVFDSWAGDLSADDFNAFALPYLRQIATRVKDTLRAEGRPVVPMTVFPRGSHYSLEVLALRTVYDVVSLDWTIDPARARHRIRSACAHMRDADVDADAAMLMLMMLVLT